VAHNPEINWEIGDKMSTSMWQSKDKGKKEKEKKSSNIRRRKDHQVGNR